MTKAGCKMTPQAKPFWLPRMKHGLNKDRKIVCNIRIRVSAVFQRWLAILVCSIASVAVADEPSTKEAEAFFESKVRPILVEHCVGCHGPKKQEAGLRLDSAAGLRKGSDNGPVVVPGDVEQSKLIEAIRHSGETKMPPKGKLSDLAIETLTTWVKRGAIWPKNAGDLGDVESIQQRSKTHWAFQPVMKPAVPELKSQISNLKPRISDEVDAFVLARLEAAGLKPSAPADRRTLIRRATFDLHGLPPTPDEVAAFDVDQSPNAFEKVVNRLLASPRYGERWARHWLDVARYADTKGYVRLKDNPNYPCSWTYRDYVIRAFNEDLPFDQFVVQQLAADQLKLGDDPRPLAAMGFLTLGQRFINSQHDIIDDRIDVVTRGLLGLTVSCARCHDHKFDAVPTRDYYSLHGVFASSLEPHVPPLILPPSERSRHEAYLKELQRRTEQLQQFMQTQQSKLETSARQRVAEYLLAAQKEKVQENFLAVMFLIDASKDLNPVMTQRWGQLLEQTRKRHHPVLAAWHALASLPSSNPDEFAAKARELIAKWRGATIPKQRINPVVVHALADNPPNNLADVAARLGELFHQAEARWRETVKADPAAKQLSDADWEELRRLVFGEEAPSVIALADVEEFLFVDTTTQNQLHDQQRQVEDWVASAGAAPHAHVLVEAAVPVAARVFVRGNAANPGAIVPRQFLEVLTRGERQPFQHGSGRLELARAIVDRHNPLTARVLVNRVWLHHFGAGLVRTPSDFGLRGEPPTHPELLDHLAWQFIADGWSIKSLHRRIMLSATWQQASDVAEVARLREPSIDRALASSATDQVDPENKLLSHMNRRRLDWESLRDSLLAVTGKLDLTMGGPAVNQTAPPFSDRRSVYGFIDRQNLPSVLRAFDFAPPDISSPQRHLTTVPQQALFLMNSPFMQEQARNLAARPDLARIESIEQRIDVVHRFLFARAAEVEEIALGKKFVGTQDSKTVEASPQLTRWQEYLQVLLLSNEFLFVD